MWLVCRAAAVKWLLQEEDSYMNMNPMLLMKMRTMMTKFQQNHPKFPNFLRAAAGQIKEGSVLEIKVTTADGESICGNIRVTADDMELVAQVKEMMQNPNA